MKLAWPKIRYQPDHSKNRCDNLGVSASGKLLNADGDEIEKPEKIANSNYNHAISEMGGWLVSLDILSIPVTAACLTYSEIGLITTAVSGILGSCITNTFARLTSCNKSNRDALTIFGCCIGLTIGAIVGPKIIKEYKDNAENIRKLDKSLMAPYKQSIAEIVAEKETNFTYPNAISFEPVLT